MRIRIIYDSMTGNTRKIADAIMTALPQNTAGDTDILNIRDYDRERDADADLYFIGYWIRRGSASVEVLRLLSTLHGKKIALFGTCGLPSSREDYGALQDAVSAFIPDDASLLGSFLCRGRMEIGVRNHCASLRGISMDGALVDRFLSDFDEAMLHPDTDDLAAAAQFARAVLRKAVSDRPLTA